MAIFLQVVMFVFTVVGGLAALVTFFPTETDAETVKSFLLALSGWITALFLLIAYYREHKRSTSLNSLLTSTENDKKYFQSELSKAITCLEYSTSILSPEQPIKRRGAQ